MREMAERVFVFLDQTGQGTIDQSTVELGLYILGCDDEARLRRLMHIVRQTCPPALPLHDFVQIALAEFQSRNVVVQRQRIFRHIKQAGGAHEADPGRRKGGEISRAELLAAVRQCRLPLTENDVQTMIDEMDPSKTGTISGSQFRKIVEQIQENDQVRTDKGLKIL